MITPQELKSKAINLYPRAISGWIQGDLSMFPYRIAANKDIPDDHPTAIREVDALRQAAKETTGHGFTIEWQLRKTRKHGLQNLPNGFVIESLDDLVAWIGKRSELRRLEQIRKQVRQRCPPLQDWLVSNWRRGLGVESDLADLLTVVEYLIEYPKPNCYIRELPLAVSTKIVEKHLKVLAEWLDIVLPESAIDYQYPHAEFAKRYGFLDRYEHHIFRVLDQDLAKELGLLGLEMSLPMEALKQVRIADCQIILVENKVNLITLPLMPRTIAMGAKGYGITVFKELKWFKDNSILYWGDIDCEGFEILSKLRDYFPHVESLMMDASTLETWRRYTILGNPWTKAMPINLNSPEQAVFQQCATQNLRLEQEHIPRTHVLKYLGQYEAS